MDQETQEFISSCLDAAATEIARPKSEEREKNLAMKLDEISRNGKDALWELEKNGGASLS